MPPSPCETDYLIMEMTIPSPTRKSEKLLIRLEDPPACAIYRIMIGGYLIPVFAELCGRPDSAWPFFLFVFGVLFLLRLIPAALRFVLPFSRAAQASWIQKRQLAKNYDSYQLRKLFWFGLGLVIYLAFSGDRQMPEITVTIGFLVAGALGLVVWKRSGARAPKGLARVN
jgi:hypothetical protein